MRDQSQRRVPATEAPRRRHAPLLHTAVIACLALGAVWVTAAAMGGCSKSTEPVDPKAGLPPASGTADKFAGDGTKSTGGPSAGWLKAPESPPASPAKAEAFEKALRAGDATAAAACIHPAYREAYQAKLMADPATMTRAADLLATRKLVAEHGREAQYEVTEGGKTYPVIFEKTNEGQWFLVAF